MIKLDKMLKMTEENGKTVYWVPLGKSGKSAPIYQEDYEALLGYGVSKTWNDGLYSYVSAYCPNIPGSRVIVARVLLNAGEGQTVRYLDGDRTNLRRENLILMKDSRAKRRDRDYLNKKEIA